MADEDASDEARSSQLNDAIAEAMRDTGMVVRWHLSVEVIDDDGDRPLLHIGSEDLRLWESLGMAEAAATHARCQIAESYGDD